jgi:lipopolysaccharide/colanic/teichoic acid biosynthesis glycosyltransferase
MTAAGLPMSQTLDEYVSRHRIKPGITGWAQINGCRGEVHTMTKLGERIALDCYYIENWSLVLDAWIMLRTLLLLVSDRHAY